MIKTDNPYILLITIVFFLATIACFATKDADPFILACAFNIVVGLGYIAYII